MPPSVANRSHATVGGRSLEQLVGEILAEDLLDVDRDAIGSGVVVADDAVGELVDERIAVEAE